jgi:glucose/arabinose dehydrogenase
LDQSAARHSRRQEAAYVAFENGKPVGTPKPVVTGFAPDDEKELHGAPVGLAQDRDGALIIADDVGNTVWRVTKLAR